MDMDEAIGLLIVGHLNMLPLDPRKDDEDFPGCCVIHCGMCVALKWLSEHERDRTDEWVRATDWGNGSWEFWDAHQGGIDWGLVQTIWDRHQGCSSANGVFERCEEED